MIILRQDNESLRHLCKVCSVVANREGDEVMRSRYSALAARLFCAALGDDGSEVSRLALDDLQAHDLRWCVFEYLTAALDRAQFARDMLTALDDAENHSRAELEAIDAEAEEIREVA